MQISFSTLACPDWTWHDVLLHGTEYGYGGVEVRLLARETDLLAVADLAPSQRPARLRELTDAGFRVCGLASSVRFDYPEAADRKRQQDIGRRYVDLAVALGAEFIRVFGDSLPSGEQLGQRQGMLRQIADGLCSLGDVAKTAGVQILLETHGDFSSSAPSAEVMQLADHSHVGLVWDTHHPWRFFSEPLLESWNRLKPWVRHTHWKDSVLLPADHTLSAEQQAAARAASSLMVGHRHADYVLFLGGEFPARECLRLLLDSGYTGWCSLEWEKMWHPEILAPEVALPLFPQKLRFLAETLGHA
ncbi:MAG TPA: sugar phosphate isomerase/epimerase family protein [Planctomycetaceae bacterium]|nr:sugar phosphate isomerase/epimerase family protein [Planctomycetaceae bacterium]